MTSINPNFDLASYIESVADCAPGVDADRCVPDATRSPYGAWTLPSHLEHRVEELKAEDPSRTIAQCFELAGATWDEGSPPEAMNFVFLDPVKTTVTQVTDGTEYRGAWHMTQQQKAQADALKSENPDWEFSRCAGAVGARWDAYSWRFDLSSEADAAMRASTGQ